MFINENGAKIDKSSVGALLKVTVMCYLLIAFRAAFDSFKPESFQFRKYF